MHLSDFDLQQLDKARLSQLTVAQKEALLEKALEDLKEARERLKADARTRSRPPSGDAPWSSAGDEEAPPEPETGMEVEHEAGDEATPVTEGQPPEGPSRDSKRSGRRPGSAGHSRTQKLPVTETIVHVPEHCALCGGSLADQPFTARTGRYVLDLEPLTTGGLCGIQLRQDTHLYGERICPCGHCTRTEPGRGEAEPLWTVALSEWHLIGPQLVSLIVCLAQRLRLSRRKIQEFLNDWLGVQLSTAVISQCLIEAGRAVEPREEALVEGLQHAPLAYADETPWQEAGQRLWRWVISTAPVCLYFIGYRSKEILTNVFEQGFAGWLMSDGYRVYRDFKHRLRCGVPLLRKARGLSESRSGEARDFGEATRSSMGEAMTAIYQAREGPPVDLRADFQDRLAAVRTLCEQHRDSSHEKTRALAREFLNDWEAIWTVLAYPPTCH